MPNYLNHTTGFITLENIINQFIIAYVGEDKLISKIKRLDVVFHAQRALQELSFDTFKSTKSREITVQPSLCTALPGDYVNYTKISWVDSSGIKHPLYPTNRTSNPTKYQADSVGEYLLDSLGNYILSGEMLENGNFNGSESPWLLNQLSSDGVDQPTDMYSFPGGIRDGDPKEGWFYGWDGNAIKAYDIPHLQGVRQTNVPIVNGEEYTLTYTISGWTGGTVICGIVDERGDITYSTGRSENGTFTETLTAGETQAAYPPETFFIERIDSGGVDGNFTIDDISLVRVGDEESSVTWGNYKSMTPSENNNDNYEDDTYWPLDGSRFGLDPQHAQANGSFFIDPNTSKIHFSSNISGKTIVLDYISDGIGGEDEMIVHKFAEEAMYKWLLHAILSTRANIPEYIVNRYKKERFAAIRQAKLRLSNIKLEEITQVLRGKSKQIKH
tara:strand:+ start:801 stop:2129 length:1329 start_codon:yes stop_codon:yes gene_type:complete